VLSRESPRRRRTGKIAAIALVVGAILLASSSWPAASAVGSTPQTITFGALADRTLNESALVVTASASSGLVVVFSTTTPAVCSAGGTNGATISPSTPGVCTVQADQAGNATFSAAPPVQQSFNVTKGSQTITFGPLDDRNLIQGALVVSATASTGYAVSFSTTTPTVCGSSGTNGATITPFAVGTCTVRADQAGNAIFDPAPPVSQSFTVSKSAQAITFGALADKTTVQSPVTVSATSTSLLNVTFSTTTPGVCTSGGTNGVTITLVASGTCTVRADQAGDATYSAAPPVSQSFTVSKSAQTITFAALADKTTVQSPVTVSATSTSLLNVTFSTTTPAVCTSSGTNGVTITLVGSGTCTVRADQAGDAMFDAATPFERSFTVSRSAQTVSFGALPDAPIGSPITVGATATSGLVVTFSTTTPAACTASGTDGATVTLVATGTCTVRADQAGNAIYNPAPTVSRSFVVTKADQTIAFGALPNVPIGPPITVGATSTSGLVVTFSTTTPSVCTAGGANGATISFVGAGTCTVRADQAGDAKFNAATSVSQSFGVGKANQTISFADLSPATLKQSPIIVAASATSTLAVSFSTTTPTICTAGGANGGTITLLAAGTCTVRADQPGDADFNAAPSVSHNFTVSKADQTISFPALSNTTLAHSPVTAWAAATSHLAVKFSTTTPTVCRTGGIDGTTIALLAAGTCTIRADQPGDAIFKPAPSVTRQFAITAPVVARERSGYWMLGSDGRIFAFGNAPDLGSAAAPAVAFSARRDGRGYWIVDGDGNVRAFGSATYRGGRPLLWPGEIVSTISGTPTGNGYWLFTTAGRAFAYGDAHFYGDMRGVRLNGPVIASIATPTGRGYYMVGSDGGVFSFGDARFHGSMGGAHLNRPIVGLSPTPDNRGYWLVAADGGVFAFGAPFRGSMGSLTLNKPVNGLVAYGNGYLMVASDGGVFNFSNRAFVGSLGDRPPAAPIVGIAAFVTSS
jgi:hypothetical protein